MLTNAVGGLQGMVDHVLVGHLVGYRANAAIGVAFQIFLVVIVFVMSIFTGMSVLVARYTGAGNREMVDRTVYQAFLTAIGIWLLVMAPIGWFSAPALLDLVHAAPEVQEEALPFLRVMFVGTFGMLIFYMLSGALRSAGDAKTPMRLGIAMTVLNLVLNVVLIRGLGPVPAFGTVGSALGTSIASAAVALYAIFKLLRGGWVVEFPHGRVHAPDWGIIRSLFRFGLPAGFQGIAMNIGGVLLISYIGSLAASAAAQASYSVAYTQLFSIITWTSVGLMGAASAVAGQNLGAGNPERARDGVREASRIGLKAAAVIGLAFLLLPRQLLALFGMSDPQVVDIGAELLRVLSLSGLFVTTALTFTGGLQGTGDTKSPLFISIVSQIVVPLGICWLVRRFSTLDPIDIWIAILCGHATRCALSVMRFNQEKWRAIRVDLDAHARARS